MSTISNSDPCFDEEDRVTLTIGQQRACFTALASSRQEHPLPHYLTAQLSVIPGADPESSVSVLLRAGMPATRRLENDAVRISAYPMGYKLSDID